MSERATPGTPRPPANIDILAAAMQELMPSPVSAIPANLAAVVPEKSPANLRVSARVSADSTTACDDTANLPEGLRVYAEPQSLTCCLRND